MWLKIATLRFERKFKITKNYRFHSNKNDCRFNDFSNFDVDAYPCKWTRNKMRPSKLKLNEKQKRLVFLIEFIFRRRNRRSRIKKRHLGAQLEKMLSQLPFGKVIISRANFFTSDWGFQHCQSIFFGKAYYSNYFYIKRYKTLPKNIFWQCWKPQSNVKNAREMTPLLNESRDVIFSNRAPIWPVFSRATINLLL